MNKLFINDKFFLIAILVDVIGGLFFSVMQIAADPSYLLFAAPLCLSAICALVLYISYQNHSKNVMKGMMGAMLMARLTAAISSLTVMEIDVDYFCAPVALLLTGLIFINHFIINSEHRASPGNIRLNQILAVLLSVNGILWELFWLPYAQGALDLVLTVIGILTLPAMCAVVVCVESRLDAYRIDREAAGWTERGGYPADYIHEFQKR